MKFTEFTESHTPRLNEVGPAAPAAAVAVVGMEGLAMALGFASVAALTAAIQQNPDAFSAPVKGAVSMYNSAKDALFGDTPAATAGAPNRAEAYKLQQQAGQQLQSATELAVQTLTPTQRNAISAMPTAADATELPTRPGQATSGIRAVVDREADAAAATIAKRGAEISAQVDREADAAAALQAKRSAEISAQVDREADARAAAADTNAVRPDTPAAGMPAADKAATTQALTPAQRNALSAMPTDIPAAPDRNDVDIISDIPAITTPDVDITSGIPDIAPAGATTAPPGATTAPPVAIPSAIAKPQTRAQTRTQAQTQTRVRATPKGKGKGKLGLPDIGGGAPSTLKSIKPTLLQINDPLNLKRNIQ